MDLARFLAQICTHEIIRTKDRFFHPAFTIPRMRLPSPFPECGCLLLPTTSGDLHVYSLRLHSLTVLILCHRIDGSLGATPEDVN